MSIVELTDLINKTWNFENLGIKIKKLMENNQIETNLWFSTSTLLLNNFFANNEEYFIDKALNDENWFVRKLAFEIIFSNNESIEHNLILSGLRDNCEYIRLFVTNELIKKKNKAFSFSLINDAIKIDHEYIIENTFHILNAENEDKITKLFMQSFEHNTLLFNQIIEELEHKIPGLKLEQESRDMRLEFYLLVIYNFAKMPHVKLGSLFTVVLKKFIVHLNRFCYGGYYYTDTIAKITDRIFETLYRIKSLADIKDDLFDLYKYLFSNTHDYKRKSTLRNILISHDITESLYLFFEDAHQLWKSNWLDMPTSSRIGGQFNGHDNLISDISRFKTSIVNELIKNIENESQCISYISIKSLGIISDKKSIKHLIKALYSNNRQYAAEALGLIGDSQAVESLNSLLDSKKNEDNSFYCKIAWALGNIGHVSSIQYLIKSLNDGDSTFKRSAVEALGKLGDSMALESLIACLDDNNMHVVDEAIKSLGHIGDLQAVKPLIQHYSKENGFIITKVLIELANGKVDYVIDALCSSSEEVITGAVQGCCFLESESKKAVYTFGYNGNRITIDVKKNEAKRLVPYLISLLKRDIYEDVINGLINICDERAIIPLIRIVRQKYRLSKSYNSHKVLLALQALGSFTAFDNSIVKLIRDTLHHKDADYRKMALKVLYITKSIRIADLQKAINDSNSNIVRDAINYSAHLNNIELLSKGLESKHFFTMTYSAYALFKLNSLEAKCHLIKVAAMEDIFKERSEIFNYFNYISSEEKSELSLHICKISSITNKHLLNAFKMSNNVHSSMAKCKRNILDIIGKVFILRNEKKYILKMIRNGHAYGGGDFFLLCDINNVIIENPDFYTKVYFKNFGASTLIKEFCKLKNLNDFMQNKYYSFGVADKELVFEKFSKSIVKRLKIDNGASAVAAEMLGKYCEVEAIDDLINALHNSTNSFTRQKSAEALGELGLKKSVAPLIREMSDDKNSLKIRLAIVNSLVKIGDPTAIESIIEEIQKENLYIEDCDWDRNLQFDKRDVLIESVGKIGGYKAAKALISLRSKDIGYNLFIKIIDTLGKIGDPIALDFLLGLLKNQTYNKYAINALGDIRDCRAINPLISILYETKSIEIIVAVIDALGKIGDSSSLNSLINILNSNNNINVQRKVIQALGEIKDTQSVPIIIEKLEDPELVIQGVRALCLIGDLRAVGPINMVLKHFNDKAEENDKFFNFTIKHLDEVQQFVLSSVGDCRHRFS